MNVRSRGCPKKYLNEPSQIKAAALQALTRRNFSADGLKERLYWRLQPEKRAELLPYLEEIIAGLEQNNLIDERQMVESWIHYRQEYAPRGRAYLRRELLHKGVREEIVDSELAACYNETAEQEALTAAFAKEVAKLPVEQERRERFWRNLPARLLRKGFTAQAVHALLAQQQLDEQEWYDK